jgi:hypothetical protein
MHRTLMGKLCFTGWAFGKVNFDELHLWLLNIAFDK